MVRPARVDRNGIKRGAWSEEEDEKLRACINRLGRAKVPNWRLLPSVAGLERCGKSCRLRWLNYLRPGLKLGNFTKDEENRIIELHKHLPNKWSAIAACFPGRTDNDIKNYWHGHIQKRIRNGAIKNHDQNLQKDNQQSFDTSSCITTSLNSSSSSSFEVNVFDQGSLPTENIGAVESNADSDYNAATYLSHNFLEKEFDTMALLFESSCNSSAAKSFDFLAEPVGEDFFNFQY